MRLLLSLLLAVLTYGQELPEHMKAEDYDALEEFHEPAPRPVPFGHIFLDGFEDPTLGLKQPIDMLEFSMRKITNMTELKQLLNSTMRSRVQVVLPPRLIPRDQHIVNLMKKKKTKEPDLPYLNFEKLHAQNIEIPQHLKEPHRPVKLYNDEPPPPAFASNKQYSMKYNSQDPPNFKAAKQEKVNWTKCEEFESKLFFYPRDVIDLEWVPFFMWMENVHKIHYAFVHRFTYPTMKLVKQYHDRTRAWLNTTVDWQRPKLLMKDLLLIAMDKRGMFLGIPNPDVPRSANYQKTLVFSTVKVLLKFLDPYLLMVFCGEKYAIVMAVSGSEPKTYKDKVAAAVATGFKGSGKPVWRNLRRERLSILAEKRRKKYMEESRILKAEPVMPSFGQT